MSARTWQLHPLAPLIATKSHERQVDRCSADSLICYSLSSCNFKQVVCLYGTGSSQVERVEQRSGLDAGHKAVLHTAADLFGAHMPMLDCDGAGVSARLSSARSTGWCHNDPLVPHAARVCMLGSMCTNRTRLSDLLERFFAPAQPFPAQINHQTCGIRQFSSCTLHGALLL